VGDLPGFGRHDGRDRTRKRDPSPHRRRVVLAHSYTAKTALSRKTVAVIFPVIPIAVAFFAFDPPLLWQIFAFFAKAGTFVFGSGLAIVPFLYGGTVKENHWLTDKQFVDAVAVAMITPGPVVITVGFIGFLVRDSGRRCRSPWHIPALLPLHDHPGAVFQEIRQTPGSCDFPLTNYRRRHRRDHRLSRRAGAACAY